jgi:3-mercaptopyruvate sulfurtransferase SseA
MQSLDERTTHHCCKEIFVSAPGSDVKPLKKRFGNFSFLSRAKKSTKSSLWALIQGTPSSALLLGSVVYCASGYRSSLAASLLQAGGFRNVRNVPGSYNAWKAAGYPVVKPANTNRKASDTHR